MPRVKTATATTVARDAQPSTRDAEVDERPEHVEATRGILGGVLLGLLLWLLVAAIVMIVARIAGS